MLAEFVDDQNVPAACELLLHDELPRDVQRALARLPAREWEIRRRRFGFDSKEVHPLEEPGCGWR